MRPTHVFLLVIAAVATFAFVMRGGADEGTAPAVLNPDSPGESTPNADADLVGPAGTTDDRATVETPTEAGRETSRQLHPAATLGNGFVGVVKTPSGDPVQGAEVILTLYGPDSIFMFDMGERIPDRVEFSGEDGSFQFRDVSAGEQYTIVAAHSGHGRATESHLSVAEGEVIENLEISLSPGIALTGTVRDSGGAPIEGARLRLSSINVGMIEDGAGVMTMSSGTSGEYEFPHLTPGQYTLTAQCSGFGKVIIQRIEIVSGLGATTQDVTLSIAHLIAGYVKDSVDGSPVAAASIEAYSNARGPEARTNTRTESDDEGYFEFGDVTEGSYTILVRATGYEPWREARVQTGEISLELNLVPLPRIEGFARTPAGVPLKNFKVRLRQTMANTEKTALLPNTEVKATGTEDGAFSLPCPNSGRYIVEVVHPRFASGFSDPVHVSDGQTKTGVEVLCSEGGTISGRILGPGGAPVVGAIVHTHDSEYVDDMFWRSLGPAYPSAATATEGRTDDQGYFTISNLNPEMYQVRIEHPDYCQQIRGEIEVREGEKSDEGQFDMTVGASLQGVIYGPSGAVEVGAVVTASQDSDHSHDQPMAPFQTRTNAQGRYAFLHLPPGHYRVSARGKNTNNNPFAALGQEQGSSRTIHLAEGKEYSENLTLSN